MKPLHAGLLIAGAALAGGLAVKMTEPQPIPVAAPAAIPAPAPVPAPIQQEVSTPPPAEQPAAAPPKRTPPKPTPVSVQIAPSAPEVFVESLKPATRKNEPILTAKAKPPVEDPAPLFVPPVPYEAPAAGPAPAASPAPARAPRRVTLPTGLPVSVRLNEPLSSDHAAAGATFTASLAEPLIVDGLVIAERGARTTGRVVDAQNSASFNGTSVVKLELTSVFTSDGQKIAISTDPWTKRASMGKIDGGSTLGAIIGAIAARAGAGGMPANVPAESIVRFRLATRVTVTERQL